MDETRFSPGPWHVGCLGGSGKCQCAYVLDEGHAGGIATVHVNNGIVSIADGGNDAPQREQAIANMHLIAAAPSLYAALVAMVDRMDGEYGFDGPHLDMAKAAIAQVAAGREKPRMSEDKLTAETVRHQAPCK